MYLVLVVDNHFIDFLFVVVVSALTIPENESPMGNSSHKDNSLDEDLIFPDCFDLFALCI